MSDFTDIENNISDEFSGFDVSSNPGSQDVFYSAVDQNNTPNLAGGANGGGFDMIDNSQFDREYNERYNSDPAFRDLIDNNPALRDELWDRASAKLAGQAQGNVVAILGQNPQFDKPNSVFYRVELPALLENPNVTHINGIPKSKLIELQNSGRIWCRLFL